MHAFGEGSKKMASRDSWHGDWDTMAKVKKQLFALIWDTNQAIRNHAMMSIKLLLSYEEVTYGCKV